MCIKGNPQSTRKSTQARDNQNRIIQKIFISFFSTDTTSFWYRFLHFRLTYSFTYHFFLF